jgi:hypothetical protein
VLKVETVQLSVIIGPVRTWDRLLGRPCCVCKCLSTVLLRHAAYSFPVHVQVQVQAVVMHAHAQAHAQQSKSTMLLAELDVTSPPAVQDVREPISMHMVVKSPARTTASQPASSPVQQREASATPTTSCEPHSNPSPQPPAAAAAAAPSGRAPQQSAPRREADGSASGAAGSGAHAAGGGAYQPHPASAWMQYQNAAATWGAPPWAMPQVCPHRAKPACTLSCSAQPA